MRLAIVGSVQLEGNAEAEAVIRRHIASMQPDTIVSGGAKGVDSMAARIGKELGLKVKIYLPQVQQWEDYNGLKGFKTRDLEIAENCDTLLRVHWKGSTTYGSGWTRDRAAERGVPTVEVTVP